MTGHSYLRKRIASNENMETNKAMSVKRIFLNASQNHNGNTASLAHKTLADLEYNTVNLIDYHINQIGQTDEHDALFKVINLISHADVLVIGTPVYWSDMTGYLKTFIDRLADTMTLPLDSDEAPLKGADIYLIIQGTAPEDAIPGITTVIKHVCNRFFMNYKGLILNTDDADATNRKLRAYRGSTN